MNKDWIKVLLLFVGFAIFFCFLSFYNQSDIAKESQEDSINPSETIFSFTVNETEEPIDGEVFVNGISLGSTENGKITISHNIAPLPDNFTFNGSYGRVPFEILFNFPYYYKDYPSLDFVVFQEDINYYDRCYKLEKSDNFPDTQKLHWAHMPLVYKFAEPRCIGWRLDNIIKAFVEIKKETNNSVYFVEGENPDILITCNQHKSEKTRIVEEPDASYYEEILGEGGITSLCENNLILSSEINFYSTMSSCGWFPFTEIHEILHTFGYNHIDKSCSIMNPEANCEYVYENPDLCGIPRIDDKIVKELKEIYGQ